MYINIYTYIRTPLCNITRPISPKFGLAVAQRFDGGRGRGSLKVVIGIIGS